jgi:ABC-type dipeptide/oligopeptide/nickel transport system permease subunit
VIIVNVTFNIADAILAVTSLGFLGLGLHYPSCRRGDLLFTGIQNMLDGYLWLI